MAIIDPKWPKNGLKIIVLVAKYYFIQRTYPWGVPKSMGISYVAEFVSQEPFKYLLPLKMAIFGSKWPKNGMKIIFFVAQYYFILWTMDLSLRSTQVNGILLWCRIYKPGTILIQNIPENGQIKKVNGI